MIEDTFALAGFLKLSSKKKKNTFENLAPVILQPVGASILSNQSSLSAYGTLCPWLSKKTSSVAEQADIK